MINEIFAIDRNDCFGNNNDLAWHYKEDLQYFKEKTLDKTCVMGEETFKSILSRNGKPLPRRTSVIASLNDYHYEGVETTHDIFGWLDAHRDEDIYVIGGKSIIELTYKKADCLYITYIDNDHEGNVFLHLDLTNFELVEETQKGVLYFRKYLRRQ